MGVGISQKQLSYITWMNLRRVECFLLHQNKSNSVLRPGHFSSGMSWDQLMSVPKFSSSRPGKLISRRILLRLIQSFAVSRIRPSMSDRFSVKPEAVSSTEDCLEASRRNAGELVRGTWTMSLDSVLSSSRGESKRGFLRGVLLKPSKSWLSRRGVNGNWRVFTGLKSSSWLPLAKGSRTSSEGVVVVETLLGVEEMGNLLKMSLTGVLKAPSSPCEQLSCDMFSRGWFSWGKEWSAPNRKGSKLLLSGKTRTGSSEQGSARRCFLLDLPTSLLSLLFITKESETALSGDFSVVNCFLSFADESGRNKLVSSLTVTVEANGDSQGFTWEPSSSFLQALSGKGDNSSPGWELFSCREWVGENKPSSHWPSSLTAAAGREGDSSADSDIYNETQVTCSQ